MDWCVTCHFFRCRRLSCSWRILPAQEAHLATKTKIRGGKKRGRRKVNVQESSKEGEK